MPMTSGHAALLPRGEIPDADHRAFAPRGKALAALGEDNTVKAVTVPPLQRLLFLPRCGVPKPDETVTTGGQPLAVRRKRQAVHARRLSGKAAQLLGGRRVPEADGCIMAPHGQHLAVRREGNAVDAGLAMPLAEKMQLFARRHVP